MSLLKIFKSFYIRFFLLLILGLVIGCGSDSSNDCPVAPSFKLEVTPYSLSMKKGTSQQFYATAIYEDGSKEDLSGAVVWSSSNESVATVSSEGLVNVLVAGEISITATYQESIAEVSQGVAIRIPMIAGTTPLEVHDKQTSIIQLYPGTATVPLGSVIKYRTVAVFADGTQQHVVHDMDVSLQNDSGIIEGATEPELAAELDPVLDQYALAKAVAVGNDKIIGVFDGVEGTAEITVVNDTLLEEIIIEPLSVITTVGSQINFYATGIYSDGSNIDLTQSVLWETGNSSIVTISNNPSDKGTASAITPGNTSVSASFSGLEAITDIIVNEDEAPEITSIEVNPVNAEILQAEFIQYSAIAHFSDHSIEDITGDATWVSSDENVAFINNIYFFAGRARGLAPGTTNISATYKGITSNMAALTVKPPEVTLESIDIAPANASIPKGTLLGYTALAFYSDGTTLNVTGDTTWESADPSVVYIETASENAGLAYAVTEGSTTISASYMGKHTSTPITVSAAGLLRIVLDPVNESVPVGTQVKYRAIGIFTDLSFSDITLLASWQSSDNTIATVGSRGSSGVVSTHAPGAVSIKASFNGLFGTAALEVTPVALQQIQVTPAQATPPLGTVTAYQATGYYSDSSVEDLTGIVTWEALDPTIIHISNDPENAGLAEALAIGGTQITAYLDNISDTAVVTVINPVPVSLTVNPAVESRPLKSIIKYSAVAIFSDGSQADVTYNVSWRSNDPSVAQMIGTGSLSGLVETLSVGQTTIEAGFGAFTAQGTLDVTEAEIVSIQVTPANVNEPAGTSVFLTASARYSDGTNEDVTALASWLSSDSSTVSVITSGDDAGLAVLLKEGTADITANYDGKSNTVTVGVTAAVLTEIQVSPVVADLPSGLSLQYHAEGIFSDGSKSSLDEEVAWRSEDINVATITFTGLAQALTPGNTSITASLNGITGTAAITVLEAEVTGIQITPANPNLPAGTRVQFSATAQLTDGSTQDVTTETTWQSSDPEIVSMVTAGADAGLAILLKEGTANITATYGGVTGTTPVQVAPAVLIEIQVSPVSPNVPNGLGVQFHAEGIFSDGGKSSLDEEVAWLSEDINVATITELGFAQALTPGNTNITATLNEIVGLAVLTVTAAEVTDIQITPADLNEPAGTSGHLTATARLSDNTTTDVTLQATWVSSNPNIVFVGNFGDYSGFAVLRTPGSAVITATYNGISDTTPVEVTPAVLESIQVTPLIFSVAKGLTVQYNARGVYSDGTITPIDTDVSWASSLPDIAIINPDGLAQSLDVGQTMITAQLDDIVGQADLQVTSAQAVEIQITPGNISEPVGTSGFLEATALLTDGTANDVTQTVTWTSSAPEIAAVGNDGEDAGFIRFLSTGDAVITATLTTLNNQGGTISDSINVTVTPAVLVEILLSPVLHKMPLGEVVQFTADGIFSDGSRTPINSDVSWLSSDISTATIDPMGLADSISVGVTTISATHIDGIAASTTLTVDPAVIVRIELEPLNLSIAAGSTRQFTVTAILSDGTTRPINENIVWQSSAPSVAAIDQGLLTAVSPGTATISATYLEFSDNSEVIVTPAILVALTLSTDQPVIHIGEVAYYLATGEYSDGSLQDLTDDVTWVSSDTSIAIVSNAEGSHGEVFGEGVGEADIQVTFEGLTDSHPIVVTPAALTSISVEPVNKVIALGLSQQYKAIGNYADGTSEDITWNVNWTSTNLAVAEIDAFGLATSLADGTTTIQASRDAIVGTTNLTVDPNIPSALVITPATIDIAKRTGTQFNATLTTGGVDSDITNQAVWSSADIAVATISNASGSEGYAQSVDEGTTTITAQYLHAPSDTTFTAAATLNVLDLGNKPLRVEVRPTDADSPSIVKNETLQFQLISFWEISPGVELEQDITTDSQTQWKSSDKKKVTISNDANKGLATGVKAGDSDIEGKYKNIKDSTNLIVTDS